MPRSSSPNRPTPRSRAAATLVGLLLTACTEIGAPAPQPVPINGQVVAAGAIRPAEARLHQLARDVPGFGGYFIDSTGGAVAYVTDLARGDALRQRIEQLARGGHLGARTGQVAIRRGDFDFPSLAHWRDMVSDGLLGVVPGVVLSDADEATNRVTIGIDEGSYPGARETVMRALVRLGIPANAVRMVPAGAVSPGIAHPLATTSSTLMSNQSVTDVPSPLVGGYSMLTSDLHPCTFGPVVQYNGHPAVVINSHCTSQTYAYDGSSISTSDANPIGTEAYDPGSLCGTKCRRSDAALIYLNSWVPYTVGRVARTTDSQATWGTSGSLTIDQTNPTIDLIDVLQPSDVTTGMSMLKTGQTTGTTRGYVTNTCVDVLASDGFKRGCSVLSNYYSDFGDSGSPVYTPAYGANGYRLVGIHWGTNATSRYSDASYFSEVMSEIPGSYVATQPSPLAVYIAGPTEVNNSPSCSLQYQAVTTGGGGGYTYSWDTDGVINSNYYDVVYAAFPGTPEGRYIQVTVTSADGSSQSAYLEVISGATYDMCY